MFEGRCVLMFVLSGIGESSVVGYNCWYIHICICLYVCTYICNKACVPVYLCFVVVLLSPLCCISYKLFVQVVAVKLKDNFIKWSRIQCLAKAFKYIPYECVNLNVLVYVHTYVCFLKKCVCLLVKLLYCIDSL